MPASHLGTSQTLEEVAFWLVIGHNVFVCSSEFSSATVPDFLSLNDFSFSLHSHAPLFCLQIPVHTL
jgi:hypothetical protein